MGLLTYTLDECDKYMDDELDKMGSDYFPLPIKLRQFQKATYDFIRENSKFLEGTQEISDNIKPLVVDTEQSMIHRPSSFKDHIWIIEEPDDYLRLISTMPYYEENGTYKTITKKVSIAKRGQGQSFERDPFRVPNNQYPLLYRIENVFKFDFGENRENINYSLAAFSYIKQPDFALEDELDKRIVNLPNISIEKIIDRATNSLRVISGDDDAIRNLQFDQTFGNPRL